MIISASRRTDIPAFYALWLERRLKDGFAFVRNPRNPALVRRISLIPSDVDCFVFWTKDARPLFGLLDRFDEAGYPYYFQWTVTPYGRDMEPGIAPKEEILSAFRTLAERIGHSRVIWRYDPVIVSEEYPAERHREEFARMCRFLEGSTERCILSFVDLYRKNRGRGFREVSPEIMHGLVRSFAESTAGQGISLQTCCETEDFGVEGVPRGACIDKSLAERLAGRPLQVAKDKNQRPLCGCCESTDIGSYDTCTAGCLYCYAVRDFRTAEANRARHDPGSPFLVP